MEESKERRRMAEERARITSSARMNKVIVQKKLK